MTAPGAGVSRRSISDTVMEACRAAGSTHLFGVPGGGSNLDLVGAAEALGVEFVLVHTETAAAVMAGVMGELTGAPGVCVATRGPGAASAVNGVAQGLLDRQPMVLVTDCVAEVDRPRISHQRLDQGALLGSVTKASVVLDGRWQPGPALAVELALAAPPGPVHLDIDPTAARSTVVPLAPPTTPPYLDGLLALVRGAQRPVVIVGVGAVAQPLGRRDELVRALHDLGAATNVPMLCTYKARGVVADRSSWCAGVATGATIERPVLEQADLIIGVGLDPVELIPAAWSYDAPVALLGSWPIDDSCYFGEDLVAELVGDLAAMVRSVSPAVTSTWPQGTGRAHRRRADEEVLAAVPESPVGLTPQDVVTMARSSAPAGTIATVDAGAHMLVAMQLWAVDAPGELLISSGLATMGFALPAAVAAALARPGRAVVCFTGDGGLGMALAELETLARLSVPVIVVVFNDSALSLIAVKQQPDGHGGAAAVTYRATDFAAIARGCGLHSERVGDFVEYERAIGEALASGRPALLDVVVDPSAYGAVLDAVRGGRPPVGRDE